MTTQYIKTAIDGGLLTITINRLKQKNALNLQMYQELTDALVELDKNPSLKVALIKGNEECFCAGNDIADFLQSEEFTDSHPTSKFLHQLVKTKKIIIAAVAGPAVGIGTTMLLHCDLVYAANNSLFQMPFSQLGLCPEAGSSYLLPKLAGHQKAFELTVLGERFNAEEAKELGIVNAVTTADTLFEHAEQKAKQLMQMPFEAVVTSKQLLKASNQSQIETTLLEEFKHFNYFLDTPECRAILSRFLAK